MLSRVPLVTVVIPAYNAAEHLREAVESILMQSFQDWELLIIDDASTDHTLQIAQECCLLDSRVKVLTNEENLGAGATRAIGVKHSRGKYLAWLDADDISMSERLSLQVQYLEHNPEVGVVGGSIMFFDEKELGKIRKYDLDDLRLRKKIFRQNPVAFPASTFRVEVFETIGNFENLRYCEDLEILLRLGTRWKFANLDEVVIMYRQSLGSLTQSNLQKMERKTLSLRSQFRSNPAYHYSVYDFIYNKIQSATTAMPVRLRMRIFSLIRGDKKSN